MKDRRQHYARAGDAATACGAPANACGHCYADVQFVSCVACLAALRRQQNETAVRAADEKGTG